MTVAATNGMFTPGTSMVYVRGSLTGVSWGTTLPDGTPTALTNNPSAAGLATNIYSGTFHNTNDSNGNTMFYKYYVDTSATWEDDPNRAATMPGAAGDPVSVARTYFKNLVPTTIPPVTNNIVFSVDMTAQIIGGYFIPDGTSHVEARGNLQGWGPGLALTNDPSLPTLASNIYSGTFTGVGQPSELEHYKYWIDTGNNWESPLGINVDGTGNRFYRLLPANGDLTLPTVYFSDVKPGDILPVDTMVVFRVDMNGAVGTDSHVFDPTSDTVHINGDFLGWLPWDVLLPQCSENPVGSRIYMYTNTFSKGHALPLTYKYSINGGDNEAGYAQNHFRYIRSPGTYIMPVDRFGNQYSEPSTTTNFSARANGPGHVLVSWIGRPGVYLQTSTSLNPPVWVDHPETVNYFDPYGNYSTNYPTGDLKTFFRLVKP
jgi:hypothetical protein